MPYKIFEILIFSKLVIGTLIMSDYPLAIVYVGDPFNIKLTSSETEEIALIPSQEGVIDGKLAKNSEIGVIVEFNDLKFTVAGTYAIFIKGSISSQITFYVTVEDLIQNIDISMPCGFSSSISDYITVYVKDINGNPWPNKDEIKLTTDDGSFETKTQNLANGQTTFNVIFKTDGSKNLTITTPKTIKTIHGAVGPRILKYTSPIQSSYNSESLIGALLYIYDTKGEIPLTDNNYLINFDLICISSCSSNIIIDWQTNEQISLPISSNSSDGVAYFGPYKIISSGKFVFKASCDKLPSAYSNEFIVTNKYKKITFTINTDKITALFNFDLTIKLIGEDGFPSTISSTIFLQNSNGSGNGMTKLTAKQGICITTLWFEIYGQKNLSVSSTLSDIVFEDSIIVEPNTIVIDDIPENERPTTTKDSFILNIAIMDCEKKIVENSNRSHTIEFSLEPYGKLVGSQKTAKTSNGRYFISDLIPKDPGDYYLIITLDGHIVYKYNDVKFSIEYVSECDMHSGPIISYSVLIVLYITLSGIFYYFDKNVRTYKPVRHLFFFIYPLTGFCYKQPGYRRLLLCAQAFVSELLIITMIGAMYFIHDSTSASIYSDFDHFDKYQLEIGVQGYALAQVPIITLFILNFYFVNNKKAMMMSIGVSVVFIFVCFGGVIYMNRKSCIGYSTYWTTNFMIFWMFDLITFQVLYSFIFMALLPKNYKILLKGTQADDLKQNQGVVVFRFYDEIMANAEGNPAVNQKKLTSSFPKIKNKDNIEESKVESETFCIAKNNAIDINVAG